MDFRTYVRCGLTVLGLFCVVLGASAATPQTQVAGQGSLADIYKQAVRDTNGDGLADSVVARVILPAAPSLQDVQAAANISARIAYETTAASLPITLTDDHADVTSTPVPILVGRNNRFVRNLEARHRLDLESLEPGQGLVALVPDAIGKHAAVVVAGADDAGTLAAAREVAARLPRLWYMTGVTLTAVQQQALDYLRREGIAADRAQVTAIVVDSERRGIAKLTLRVRVPDGTGSKALRALRKLDAAHRRGEGDDTLDFAEVASTAVEVATSRGVAGRFGVGRVGASWRALVNPPPAPVTPTLERLVATAKSGSGADSASRHRHACVGCPVYLLNGLIPGGGGGSYSSVSPRQPAQARSFDLSEVYSINGWFGDRYRDLIPDTTRTSIIVGGKARESLGAAHVAARLGLESTGITLPIVRGEDTVIDPRNEPSPILIGRDNKLVQALEQAGKIRLDGLKAGEGVIEVVPHAFGAATATVVAGADAAGADAASGYLARHVPHVWDTRPGAVTLKDVKTQVSDFLAGRTAAGQAARAVEVQDKMLGGAGSDSVHAVDLKLYLNGKNEKFGHYLQRQIEKRRPRADVSVATVDAHSLTEVFKRRIEAPWEGSEFWSRLRTDVLPRIGDGDSVEIQAWLSEDPATRKRLEQKTSEELRRAGAAKVSVSVHSAYKQGLFWLTEQVLPDLKSLPVASVRIKVRKAKSDASSGERVHQLPTRWLKSLYPADEIFKRDIGLPIDAFHMEMVDEQEDIYSLQALDADGHVVYTSRFSPYIYERPYLKDMPGTDHVQVETGHFLSRINGHVVSDVRIATDLERFWSTYVHQILPRLRHYVMSASGGTPSKGEAPYFRDLTIQAFVSEPDYDFGIEGEHMSSAEALEVELFDVTEAVLGSIGARTAGRIVPLVRVRPDRKSEATVLLTRNAAPDARMQMTYRRGGDAEDVTVTRKLESASVGVARVTRIVAGAKALQSLSVEVTMPDEDAASRAVRVLQDLERFHRAGLFKAELSYRHVKTLDVVVIGPKSRQTVVVHNTGTSRPDGVYAYQRRPARPLVKWDHVIGPSESEEIIRKLSYYPSVAAYRAATSYEGRDISVLEMTAPAAGKLVSIAKLSEYKPTMMVVGRQHGSEPSSTSFILGMAERLASDPDYKDVLQGVNVVFLPIMNPDGAAMAARIRQIRPMDIARPGYLSAIAQDVSVSTKLAESTVGPYLWRRWLPDIYLNAHGAASHEVTHPLHNYVPTRAPTYSFRRGWYLLAFRMPRDPRYPKWGKAALALRDAMTREINSDARNRVGNLKDYRRFARWGHYFSPHLEPLELYNDVMMFYSDPGSGEIPGIWRFPPPPPDKAKANRKARISDWPLVTLDAGTIEAADEGATGELLKLAIRDGFSALMAHLKYLRDGRYQLQKIEEDAPGDGARFTTVRVRPVMPPEETAVPDNP